MPKKLVIFDCDGTLADTEMLHAEAMVRSLRGYGISYEATELQAACMGKGLSGIVDMLNYAHDLSLEVGDMCMRHVREMKGLIASKLRVPREDVDYVRGLAGRDGVFVSVASNGTRAIVLASLGQAGYLSAIGEENVLVAADVAAPKPAPDMLLALADKFGVHACDCVVVEDSPSGAQAGMAAGMHTVGYVGYAHDERALCGALRCVGVKDFIRRMPDLERHLRLA